MRFVPNDPPKNHPGIAKSKKIWKEMNLQPTSPKTPFAPLAFDELFERYVTMKNIPSFHFTMKPD